MAGPPPSAGCPAALTFLLQLPVDLRLPSGATLLAFERAEDVELPLIVDDRDSAGLVPDTRFVFRRSAPESSPARSVVMDVFADFWQQLEFRDSEPAYADSGRSVPVAAVAATTGAIGAGDALTPDEIARAFDRVLDQLNGLLTMLGYVFNDPDVGPVRRTELPSHIATVIDLFETPRVVELSTLQLHSFGDDDLPDEEAILYGHDLAFRDRLGWPFKETVASLQRARREIYGGETAFGVLLLGTASELLIATTVRECMSFDGRPEARIAGVAAAPFRSIKDDHFAPLLERLGADMATLEAWTRDCYRLRNSVAHEGYRPSGAEARAALRATLDLAGELGDGLRKNPGYRALGDELPCTRSSDGQSPGPMIPVE